MIYGVLGRTGDSSPVRLALSHFTMVRIRILVFGDRLPVGTQIQRGQAFMSLGLDIFVII